MCTVVLVVYAAGVILEEVRVTVGIGDCRVAFAVVSGIREDTGIHSSNDGSVFNNRLLDGLVCGGKARATDASQHSELAEDTTTARITDPTPIPCLVGSSLVLELGTLSRLLRGDIGPCRIRHDRMIGDVVCTTRR